MREILEYGRSTVFGVISALLVLKLYEICHQLASVAFGLGAINDIARIARAGTDALPEKKGHNDQYTELEPTAESRRASLLKVWPVTGRLVRNQSSACDFALRIAFRYRSLILCEAGIVAYSTQPFIGLLGGALVFLGIWVEIARLLCDRLVLGSADNWFRGALGKALSPNRRYYFELQDRTALSQARHFVRLLAQMLAITTVGYAAIYCGLDAMAGANGAFSGVPHNLARFPHLLYFSIITIATVGYGDLFPTSLLARAVTASEVIAGFIQIVVFATSVALTFKEE